MTVRFGTTVDADGYPAINFRDPQGPLGHGVLVESYQPLLDLVTMLLLPFSASQEALRGIRNQLLVALEVVG